MATSLWSFGPHIHPLVIRFGDLEPVAHLMHSALMVMFWMPIIALCFSASGRGTTQPSHELSLFLSGIPTGEVQEVV